MAALVLAGAASAILREYVKPRYQRWLVNKVASGEWTMNRAREFERKLQFWTTAPLFFFLGASFPGALLWLYFLTGRCY